MSYIQSTESCGGCEVVRPLPTGAVALGEKLKGWLPTIAILGFAFIAMKYLAPSGKPKKRKNPKRRKNPDRYGFKYTVSAFDLAGISFKSLAEARRYVRSQHGMLASPRITNIDTGKSVPLRVTRRYRKKRRNPMRYSPTREGQRIEGDRRSRAAFDSWRSGYRKLPKTMRPETRAEWEEDSRRYRAARRKKSLRRKKRTR